MKMHSTLVHKQRSNRENLEGNTYKVLQLLIDKLIVGSPHCNAFALAARFLHPFCSRTSASFAGHCYIARLALVANFKKTTRSISIFFNNTKRILPSTIVCVSYRNKQVISITEETNVLRYTNRDFSQFSISATVAIVDADAFLNDE